MHLQNKGVRIFICLESSAV